MISVSLLIIIPTVNLINAINFVNLGWELNILESVVVTLAIGLSVDFTLHYGIMYKLAADTDRLGPKQANSFIL